MFSKTKNKAVTVTPIKGKSASGDPAGNEYRQRLRDVGRPLACKVSVINSKPSGEFTLLDVLEEKKSVSFPYENGGIGYKTLTHVLSNDIAMYGLACSPDGTVEVYVLDDDPGTNYDAEFVGDFRVRHHVVDPMFAFSSANGVYVVFNAPTLAARNSGAKARKPVPFPDENLSLAQGSPVLVKFEFGEGKGKSILPKMEPMARYIAGILDDPKSDYPLIMVANILNHSEEEAEFDAFDSRPSFGKLIEELFSDDEMVERKLEEFPIGVSVARITDEAPKFDQVPMGGNLEYGIQRISIAESEDGENNAVEIEAVLQ